MVVRRKFGGAIVEFCRDQKGWDYDQFRLIVSNTSQTEDGTITDPYKATTRTACPEEWSGYITVTTTIDATGPNYERHESDRQRWTISATSQTPPPGVRPVMVGDYVDLTWSASFQDSGSSGGQCPSTTDDGGEGHDTTHAQVLVAGGRMFLSPLEMHSFDVTNNYADCGSQSTVTTTMGEELEVALAGAGGAFAQDPNDPNSYVGNATPINDDEIFAGGGEQITRQTVQWNFQRIIPGMKTQRATRPGESDSVRGVASNDLGVLDLRARKQEHLAHGSFCLDIRASIPVIPGRSRRHHSCSAPRNREVRS